MTTVVISSSETSNIIATVTGPTGEDGDMDRSNCAVIEMEINGNAGLAGRGEESKTDTAIVLDNKHLLQVPGHDDNNGVDNNEEGDFDDE